MPNHTHDCDKCIYLGETGTPKPTDLYYCEQGGFPTLIARYSSEPSDYSSGLKGEFPGWENARDVARARGLIV